MTDPCRYTLQVRVRFFSSLGVPATRDWTHVVCRLRQYAVLTGQDTVTCKPCPLGGDCRQVGPRCGVLIDQVANRVLCAIPLRDVTLSFQCVAPSLYCGLPCDVFPAHRPPHSDCVAIVMRLPRFGQCSELRCLCAPPVTHTSHTRHTHVTHTSHTRPPYPMQRYHPPLSAR